MHTHKLFMKDCTDMLREDVAAGRVSRRDFLQLAALLGASAAMSAAGVGRAHAASESITLANYGGDATKAYEDAWGNDFTGKTGVQLNIDGSGPLVGRVKKMVDDGAVTWDVVDGSPYYGLQLGKDYAEPIDYSVVDKSKYYDWNANDFAAGSYTFSNVLTYDTTKFSEPPKTWADFFDLKKFPGKRVMFKWFDGQPEVCMLAAGKSPNEIYPIDMKLVADKIASLGDQLVLWDSGAMSQQVFLDGEVVMGNIWNTRAARLKRDTNGRIDFTWNQQVVQPGAWLIPKGSKNVANAQKFIAATQDIASQVKLLELLGNSPANKDAVAKLTDEQKKLNLTSHLDGSVLQDAEWYATNYNEAFDQWTEAIGG